MNNLICYFLSKTSKSDKITNVSFEKKKCSKTITTNEKNGILYKAQFNNKRVRPIKNQNPPEKRQKQKTSFSFKLKHS